MNLFVTGGTGGLGSVLIPHLLKCRYKLLLLTRRIPDGTSHPNVRYVQGDLLDPSGYVHVLSGIDVVIHMAGLTHSHKAERYVEVNAHGTACLLQALKETGFQGRFLFISTRAIGDHCGAYGKSKLTAEAAIKESGISWTVFRPAEIYRLPQNDMICNIIRIARKKKIIPVPGNGNYALAPVYAEDVAKAILNGLWNSESIGKTYTLAGPESIAYKEMVDKIIHAMGIKIFKLPLPLWVLRCASIGLRMFFPGKPILVYDQIPRLICRKCSKIQMASQDLDFYPRSFDEGLKELLNMRV